MNVVYILQCSDNSLYTGWTNDLENRLQAHQRGVASKYTRSRRPLSCVLVIYCQNDTQARSVEAKIKRLSRKEKLQILADNSLLTATLKQMTGEILLFARSFVNIE